MVIPKIATMHIASIGKKSKKGAKNPKENALGPIQRREHWVVKLDVPRSTVLLKNTKPNLSIS